VCCVYTPRLSRVNWGAYNPLIIAPEMIEKRGERTDDLYAATLISRLHHVGNGLLDDLIAHFLYFGGSGGVVFGLVRNVCIGVARLR
jgi:hypothetical protein